MFMLDEPDEWAVMICFHGEVVDIPAARYTSPNAVNARVAQLRAQRPFHDIKVLHATKTWDEVAS